MSEKSAAVPQANADSDGAKRGLSPTREHFDKLKQTPQKVQPVKERVEQQTWRRRDESTRRCGLWCHRQVPTVQQAQKTVDLPQSVSSASDRRACYDAETIANVAEGAKDGRDPTGSWGAHLGVYRRTVHRRASVADSG